MITDINESALEETKNDVSSLTDVVSLAGNIASEALNQKLVELAIDTFGRLDIAVNNAGIAHNPAPVHQMTEEIMDTQFAVNVKGVMFGMKYQVPVMLAQKQGHILNVSSLAGLGGAPKGALTLLQNMLSRE